MPESRERANIRAAETRKRNRAYVSEINARTVCAHCGSQPVEWHNPDHAKQGKDHQRIARLIGKCRSIAFIQAEIDRCTPLCRRCHMAEDGRLESFRAQAKAQERRKPPRPCVECSRLVTVTRHGRCSRCDGSLRRARMSAADRERARERQRQRYYTKTVSGENLGAVQARLRRQSA